MISLCFDDGKIECFKWCRYLHSIGIRSTVYVNPSTLGQFEFLTVDHLKRIQDEWKHVIGNHLYKHTDCPANDVSISDIIKSYEEAKDWLVANSFSTAANYVALPYGYLGGKWSDKSISTMLEHCSNIRDVSAEGVTGINDTNRIYGLCDKARDILAGINEYGKSKNELFTIVLHNNKNTTDNAFITIADELEKYKDYIFTINELKGE